MSAEDQENEGTILEVLPKGLYRVKLANGTKLRCHVGREARRHLTQLNANDRVTVQVSPLDVSRGKITAKR